MKQAKKKVEIAYMIPRGREGRFTAARKVTTEDKLEAVCAKLVEDGARDFSFSTDVQS